VGSGHRQATNSAEALSEWQRNWALGQVSDRFGRPISIDVSMQASDQSEAILLWRKDCRDADAAFAGRRAVDGPEHLE
jgi:hypothetical protein